MPRKLPWQQESVGERKSSAGKAAVQRRPAPISSTAEEDDFDIDAKFERPRKARRTEREPSSSPPPVIAPPPAEELMIEGYSADDGWIMVEDEFMATARLFTRHLHQAEYDRLKRLAKARNTGAIQDISQAGPRGSQASASSKLQKRAEALDADQRLALGPYMSDGDSGDDPWTRNPHLTGVKSNTRAAAGFREAPKDRRRANGADEPSNERLKSHTATHEEQSTDEDGDDDDLDALPRRQLTEDASVMQKAPGPSSTTLGSSPKPEPQTRDTHHRGFSPPGTLMSGSPAGRNPPASSSTSFADRMAGRKAALRKKEREEKVKIESLDQVPTFLI